MTFDDRSLTNLEGVHPHLVKVALQARSQITFVVTEGLRTLEQQEQKIKEGKSFLKDARSGRHVSGHAIDVAALDAGGKVTWDLKYYPPIALEFNKAAHDFGVPLVWGGNWKQRDACHFELEHHAYPGPAFDPSVPVA